MGPVGSDQVDRLCTGAGVGVAQAAHRNDPAPCAGASGRGGSQGVRRRAIPRRDTSGNHRLLRLDRSRKGRRRGRPCVHHLAVRVRARQFPGVRFGPGPAQSVPQRRPVGTEKTGPLQSAKGLRLRQDRAGRPLCRNRSVRQHRLRRRSPHPRPAARLGRKSVRIGTCDGNCAGR